MVLLSVEQKETKNASVFCIEMTAGEFQLLENALGFSALNNRVFGLEQVRDMADMALMAHDDWVKFEKMRKEWLTALTS